MAESTSMKTIDELVGKNKKKPVKKAKDSRDVVRETPPTVQSSSKTENQRDYTSYVSNPLTSLIADMMIKMGLGPKDAEATAKDIGKNLTTETQEKLERVVAAEAPEFDTTVAEPAPEGDVEAATPAPTEPQPKKTRSGFAPVTAADDEPNKVRSVPVEGPVPTANDPLPVSRFTGRGTHTSPVIDERVAPAAPAASTKAQDRVPMAEDEDLPGWVDSILNPRTTSDGMGGSGPGLTAKEIMERSARGFTDEPYKAPAQANRYGGVDQAARDQLMRDEEARLDSQLAKVPAPVVEKPAATAAGAARSMAESAPPNLGPTSWMDDFVRYASEESAAPAVAQPQTATAPASTTGTSPGTPSAPGVTPQPLTPAENRMAVAEMTPRLTTTDSRSTIEATRRGELGPNVMTRPFGVAPQPGAIAAAAGDPNAPVTPVTELAHSMGQTIFDPGRAEATTPPSVNAATPIDMTRGVNQEQGAPVGSLPPVMPGGAPPPMVQNYRESINPLNNQPFATYSAGGWDVTSFGDGAAIRSTQGVNGYTQSWDPTTSSWSGSPSLGGAALSNTSPSSASPQVYGQSKQPYQPQSSTQTGVGATPNWYSPH